MWLKGRLGRESRVGQVWLKGRLGRYKLITIGFIVSSVSGRNFAMSNYICLGPKILYKRGGVKKKVY